MVGKPLETAGSWDRELDELLNFQPDGISFYNLTLEEGTPLSRRAERGETVHLTAEETVDLLLHCADRLSRAGYRHYEVSNWAKPGLECRHNIHCWDRGSYLGLEPSAHSFDGKIHRRNVANLKVYQSAIEANRLPPGESGTLSMEEARTEWVYLKLRQAEGLDFQAYAEEFGEVPSYWAVMFEKIAQRGPGSFDEVRFQPNDRGMLLADEIAARILA